MNYQWILFDADDTLFHFDAFRGLQLMFSRFNVDFRREDYDHYQSLNAALWVDYQNGRVDAGQVQTTRFEPWAERLKVSTTRLNSAFLEAMAEVCTLLPGALDLIEAMRGQYRMGIITNGFTELQIARLERNGLTGVFHPLVISEQVGVAKPDVAIFEYAFERMGYPDKNRILMVGDNPHSDIQGGHNAGIHTCWYNAYHRKRPEGIEPNYEVASLRELQALLLSSSTAASEPRSE